MTVTGDELVGLQLWFANEGPVIPTAFAQFSKPEEGMAKLQQHQEHINCVFDCEGVVHHKYTPPGQTKKSATSMFFVGWEMQYDKNSCTYGPLVTGSFVTATRAPMHHVFYSFLVKHQINQATQSPTAKIGALPLLAFPKTKITFEREGISELWWDSGKYDGVSDGNSNKGFCSVFNSGRGTMRTVRSQGACFEGDWGIIVLCMMSLVSCTFFNKCLHFSYSMAGWYFLDRPCVHLRSLLYLHYCYLYFHYYYLPLLYINVKEMFPFTSLNISHNGLQFCQLYFYSGKRCDD